MKSRFFAAVGVLALGCSTEPSPATTAGLAEKTEPHPAGAARVVLAERSALLLQLENALSARELTRARALMREHARRFSELEGAAEERQGFAAIAGCLEHPGQQARDAAERFIAEHRASPLRRKVRRACLGARAPMLLRQVTPSSDSILRRSTAGD
jgi:hypothetical protein